MLLLVVVELMLMFSFIIDGLHLLLLKQEIVMDIVLLIDIVMMLELVV